MPGSGRSSVAVQFSAAMKYYKKRWLNRKESKCYFNRLHKGQGDNNLDSLKTHHISPVISASFGEASGISFMPTSSEGRSPPCTLCSNASLIYIDSFSRISSASFLGVNKLKYLNIKYHNVCSIGAKTWIACGLAGLMAVTPVAKCIDVVVSSYDLDKPTQMSVSDDYRGNALYRLAQLVETEKAYAADTLPSDLYNPRGPEVSEQNFKQTLAKEGLVWVMYDWTGAKKSDRDYADAFWSLLKDRFGNQVNGYIRINTDNWSNNGALAIREITKDNFPAFVLYKNGTVVNDGTPYDIRIRGPPDSEHTPKSINYILEHSELK